MINNSHLLPIKNQCLLLDLARSSFYYQNKQTSSFELSLRLEIDKINLDYPFYGSRKILQELIQRGFYVARDTVRRIMRLMKIEALYRKPRTSIPRSGSKIYPYLLKNLKIERPNQVWASDITYIPMAKGFAFLVAILDLKSRKVLSWKLSNIQDANLCLEALEEAIQKYGRPEIFNTDQGSQFTAECFINGLKGNGIKISMDGKRRWIDNVFVERLWRTIKYEEVYLKAYENITEARKNIKNYLQFYNQKRFHQALDYLTPNDVYYYQVQDKLAA